MPVTAPERPANALFRALRDAHADPDLAHEASEEVRSQAGRNVIAVVEARFDAMEARFDAMEARFDAIASRIDVLQRVIWPLIGILATTVFGLLYRIVAE